MQRRFAFRLARLRRVRDIEERVARAEWGRAEADANDAAARQAGLSRELSNARQARVEAQSAGAIDPDQMLLEEYARAQGIAGMIAVE